MKDPKILFIAAGENVAHRCSIGKYCYAADVTTFNVEFYNGPECKLSIGNFVSFGPNITVYVGGEHRTDWGSTYHFSEIFSDVEKTECIKTKGDVIIGSDVWVGGNVVILSGVTIGHGAVIGAGAVVSKDVAPYSIVVGNPLRELRKRFTEEQRTKLLQIRWWDWEDEKINKIIPLLMSDDIDTLIDQCEMINLKGGE